MGAIEVTGSLNVLRVALKDVPEDMIEGGIKGGETVIKWDKDNPVQVIDARKPFDELRHKGYAAFAVAEDGQQQGQIFEFDSKIERIIFHPAMAGG